MSIKFWRSLAFRTGIALALSSALLTVVISYSIYNRAVEQVIDDSNRRISQLVITVKKSAAIAAYLENNELALEVTRGIANNDIVSGVALRSQSGMRVISGQPFAVNNENSQKFVLPSPFMPDEIAGEILVLPNQQYISAQAKQSALVHVYTLAIHSIMLTIVVIFLVHRLLAKPLSSVAEALHEIEPGSKARLNCPMRHQHDEIGQLVIDTNHLLTAAQNTLEGERRLREYVESLQQAARREAERDPLTGLLNRRAGEKAIPQAFRSAKSNNTQCAILLIDLDRFKPINDTHGHEAGDQVLIEVAKRLTHSLRQSDIIIRWGGDEFLVMIQQGHTPLDTPFVAEKLLTALTKPIPIDDGKEVQIGASIGVSIYPDHGEDPNVLFDLADKAMYHVKHSGRNDYFIHQPKSGH